MRSHYSKCNSFITLKLNYFSARFPGASMQKFKHSVKQSSCIRRRSPAAISTSLSLNRRPPKCCFRGSDKWQSNGTRFRLYGGMVPEVSSSDNTNVTGQGPLLKSPRVQNVRSGRCSGLDVIEHTAQMVVICQPRWDKKKPSRGVNPSNGNTKDLVHEGKQYS